MVLGRACAEPEGDVATPMVAAREAVELAHYGKWAIAQVELDVTALAMRSRLS